MERLLQIIKDEKFWDSLDNVSFNMKFYSPNASAYFSTEDLTKKDKIRVKSMRLNDSFYVFLFRESSCPSKIKDLSFVFPGEVLNYKRVDDYISTLQLHNSSIKKINELIV